MWMLFSIRLEPPSRTAYLLGQVRWTSGEAGATVVDINAWPSDFRPGVFFYNAFIATYNDPELFRFVIQEAGCDDDDGINDDSTTGEEKGKEEQGDEEGGSGAGGAPPHFVDASPGPGFAAGTSRAAAAEQQQYYSRVHGEEEEEVPPPPPHLEHAAAITNPWVELMASLEEKRGGPISSNVDTAEMKARGDTSAFLQEALRVWQAENVSARPPREQEQGGRCSPSSSDLPRDPGDGEGSE